MIKYLLNILAIAVLGMSLTMASGWPVVKAGDSNGPAGYSISRYVITSGGTANQTSESYYLSNLTGLPITGAGSSDNYATTPSFWPPFGWTCCNLPGDANNDGEVNVGDVVYIINYVFKGGSPPSCMDEGDANADCGVNVGDGVYLIAYIFKGGPPPVCGCAE